MKVPCRTTYNRVMLTIAAGSIRWRLFVLVVAVAVPLLGVLIWGFTEELEREHRDAREAALRIARSFAADTRASNERSRALLLRMATRARIRAPNPESCDSIFAIVEFFPQYLNLLLYDANGRLVCAATPQPADAGSARVAQEHISLLLREGGETPRQPMVMRGEGRWISVVFQDTVSRRKRSGVLALVQYLELDASSHPEGTVITIVDRDGRILARSSDGNEWVGRDFGETEIARLAGNRREGVAQARGVVGELRQYGYSTIDDSGWRVFAGVPTDVAMAEVRALRLRGLVAGSVVLLLVGLLAVKISATVERPLQVLASAARRTADEGYGVRVPGGGPSEVASLADAFNRMVDSRAGAELALVESQKELQALSKRLLQIQEEERTRIAREIHDELGQLLTALKMDAGGLVKSIDAPSPQQRAMIERIYRALDETISSIRRIASELRPATLDDFGLSAAIQTLVASFEERTGIECDLSIPDEPLLLDSESETTVYRIVQEALTNVARHSDATRVEIRVRVRELELVVDVRDDGRGLGAERLHDDGALGLAGMRERARRVDGMVEIEGVEGKGTIVSLRLPLQKRDERVAG
ncbi:MAG: histidine kinase [Thermoanaerobaculia bacterium]|jgi:signal transduction histidine kinase